MLKLWMAIACCAVMGNGVAHKAALRWGRRIVDVVVFER